MSFMRVSVWLWTPSTPLITRMARSRTLKVLSISALKSAWPGVSTRITSVSCKLKRASLENTVIPLAFSMESLSRKVSPLSTLPTFLVVPVR